MELDGVGLGPFWVKVEDLLIGLGWVRLVIKIKLIFFIKLARLE